MESVISPHEEEMSGRTEGVPVNAIGRGPRDLPDRHRIRSAVADERAPLGNGFI